MQRHADVVDLSLGFSATRRVLLRGEDDAEGGRVDIRGRPRLPPEIGGRTVRDLCVRRSPECAGVGLVVSADDAALHEANGTVLNATGTLGLPLHFDDDAVDRRRTGKGKPETRGL